MYEKMYQVFISSTKKDLIEERKIIEDNLLKLNFIPRSMEFFNASSSCSWDIIRRKLEPCDYLVLVIAGRYGSIYEETGLGFTEMEYDFAREKGIQVLPFIHEGIDALPASKIDTNPVQIRKLKAFTQRVKKDCNCRFWSDPNQLGSDVLSALTEACQTNPATGWVRADSVHLRNQGWVKLDHRLDFSELNEKLANARTACVYALGCTATTQELCQMLGQGTRHPESLRMIYMDPSGQAVRLAAKRQNTSVSQTKKMYSDNLLPLVALCKELGPSLQVRVLDFLPPYNLFIFNPDGPDAELLLHLSAWQSDSNFGRPLLHIRKQENSGWFHFYLTEFEKLWKISREPHGFPASHSK